MIVSAMIFAGAFMIFGLVLGFRLGQARSRMSYEEQLRKAEEARASIEVQLDRLRGSLPVESRKQSASPGPSNSVRE
jgi:hypothetical protein